MLWLTRRKPAHGEDPVLPRPVDLRGTPGLGRWPWMLALGLSLMLHLGAALYLIMAAPAMKVLSLDDSGVLDQDATYDRARQWAQLAPQPRKPVAHAVSMTFVPPAPVDSGSDVVADDPTAGSSEDAVEQMAARQRERIDAMSDAERMDEFRQRTQQLNRMDSEAVGGALGAVESLFGVPGSDDRRMAPRDGAEGEFDHATMVLYDIVKNTADDGQVIYEHIWVDAEGRTWRQSRPASEMDASERRMAQIYEMARENPSLRPLLESVLKMEAAQNAPKQPAGGR